ncbi:hypothetical protein RF11_03740 [Thelohanellus kitauei]|uniref:Uncharacterized protein n=1 Tax=Thelohanellus kitauei TaxID=669202 RepID=A0A0C2J304_THEKT|nr:hypothetical protein RF11_03740 [Thelohanellus kitauei]
MLQSKIDEYFRKTPSEAFNSNITQNWTAFMSFIIPGNRFIKFLLNAHEISQIECYAKKILNKSLTSQTFEAPDSEVPPEPEQVNKHKISHDCLEIIQPPQSDEQKENKCPTISLVHS